MRAFARPFRSRPAALVVAPLLLLTVLFGSFTVVMMMKGDSSPVSSSGLMLAGILVYAATLFTLSAMGLSSIRELKDLGHTDSLTKLPNRRALHESISAHADGEEEIALALIDLDGFKQVNDHFGHFVGDEVIRQCAILIQEVCEPEARAYRLGGDEYAVVMIGAVAGTILEGMCRSLIGELAKAIPVGDRRLSVGASIGLSKTSSAENLSSSELLRRSDVAMYASKRSGRNRCTWFSKDFDRDREAVQELDGDLRKALANNEFVLHYQPLVDANTQRIVAVESLIRWERPTGERVGPHLFIPVAEDTGLINPLGLWVLRQACTDALHWGEITLSVNISAAQLRNPEFPVNLGQILEETGFPAHRLELEITETCLVLDPILAERSLDVIRGFGVNVSLDDFGTGYASIGFLRQFRFEKLKLDRSLVVQAGEDDGSRAMMLSSITVARALKMGVTAEGVETEEQAQMVRTAGCDQIQGWLYYKAMPSAEIHALLDQDMMPEKATKVAPLRSGTAS